MVITHCLFTFTATKTNKINVHIESKKILNTTEDSPCTNLYIYGCSIKIQNILWRLFFSQWELKLYWYLILYFYIIFHEVSVISEIVGNSL